MLKHWERPNLDLQSPNRENLMNIQQLNSKDNSPASSRDAQERTNAQDSLFKNNTLQKKMSGQEFHLQMNLSQALNSQETTLQAGKSPSQTLRKSRRSGYSKDEAMYSNLQESHQLVYLLTGSQQQFQNINQLNSRQPQLPVLKSNEMTNRQTGGKFFVGKDYDSFPNPQLLGNQTVFSHNKILKTEEQEPSQLQTIIGGQLNKN